VESGSWSIDHLSRPFLQDLGPDVIARRNHVADIGALGHAINDEPVRRALIRVSKIDSMFPDLRLDLRPTGELPIDVVIGAHEAVDSVGERDLVDAGLEPDRHDATVAPVAQAIEEC